MGQRLYIGGRGSSYNLWPAQCFLNLLNFFKTAFRWAIPHSWSYTVFLSSHCPLESVGSSQTKSVTIWGGWNPHGALPRWLQHAAKVEKCNPVILKLSHLTHLLYLAAETSEGFVVAFPPACDSNSSPATFCVNLALIFLLYKMEIRMIYFTGITRG